MEKKEIVNIQKSTQEIKVVKIPSSILPSQNPKNPNPDSGEERNSQHPEKYPRNQSSQNPKQHFTILSKLGQHLEQHPTHPKILRILIQTSEKGQHLE